MTDAPLARTDEPRNLSVLRPTQEFRRLSLYGEDGFADQTGRLGELACISAGYNANKSGKGPKEPKVSRPQDPIQIYLHDPYQRARGLAEALTAGQHRHLLITFPDDNPAVFIRQRYMFRTQTRVSIYGDELGNLYVIGRVVDGTEPGRYKIQPPADGEKIPHQKIEPGSEVYNSLRRACKPEFRIYFNLMEYNPDGVPEVVFPDGLGVYAIRTTSTHTVDEITGYIDYVKQFTGGRRNAKGRMEGGRIAGIPFQLEVVYRDVPDPGGSTRTIPIFSITTKPPEGVRMSGRIFADIAKAGLEESDVMRLVANAIPGPNMLPAPDKDPFEASFAEVDEPDERALEMLATGAPVDWRDFTASWHVRTNGTPFDEKLPNGRERRSEFLREWSGGQFSQLEDVQGLSQADADALIAALSRRVEQLNTQARARRYDDIFDVEDGFGAVAARSAAAPVLADQGTREPASARQQESRAAEPMSAQPAAPAAPAAPTANADEKIRGTSALAQAFQKDVDTARRLGMEPGELHEFLVPRWPASRALVEQRREALKTRLAELEHNPTPAPAEPTTRPQAAPVEASPAAAPKQPAPPQVEPAAQSETEPAASAEESEVWQGDIPEELDFVAENRPDAEPPSGSNGKGGDDPDTAVLF